MLHLFRNSGLTKVVYGIIIIGMVLVFILGFNPSAGKKTASIGEQCAAQVSGWCITPKDHMAAYRIMIPRGQSGELLTAKAKQQGLLKVSLDGLIERELLVREADRLGLATTDDEVSKSIYNGFILVSVPSDNPSLAYSLHVQDGKIYVGFHDQKSHRFDMKVYERNIRMLVGRSATEFREEQARELTAAKVRDLVRAPVRVSEPEALASYIAEKSTATIKYVPVKQSFVSRYAVAASSADVEAWAKDKANESFIDSTVTQRKTDALPKAEHIRHILSHVTPTASAEDKALALGKLARAYQRIKSGEAFADVAREMSDDTGSAAHGGDVGDKTDGFVAPFKKAADALKPGEMTSAAIQTQFGYHLIEKDDPAKSAEVEAAVKRDTVHELYVKTKALEATKELANKILAGMKAGRSAEDAIKDALTPLEKPAAPLPPLAVIAEAPEASKTETGDAGAATAAASPVVLPKAATALTDPDRPQVTASSSFNHGGEPIEDAPGDVTAKVLAFAFSAKDNEVMPEPARVHDGFVVVQLKEHKLATKEDFEKERDTYLQTLLTVKQSEALGVYVRRLREKSQSEIKIDEAYMAAKKGPEREGGAPAPDEEEEEEGP